MLSSVIVVKLPGVAPPVTSVKKATVPLPFWNVIVLSAVGSTTVKVVSFPSAVAPSNTILPVVVIVPESIVPAAVTFAPLNVNAVVVPDLIIKFPPVLVKLA